MSKTPAHIAIVMDGNGRWAKQRSLPVSAGHKAGVETVRRVLTMAQEAGVSCLTLYAFSSENWRRPKLEVRALMTLFSSYLDAEVNRLHEEGVQLRFIGRRDRFSATLVKKIEDAEAKTATNRRFHLNLAVDYGGREDIAAASRLAARDVQLGKITADEIDEDYLARYMALADLPEPDLFIRTSGEYRISNFLLWQLSYAELHFAQCLWPDFSKTDFSEALAIFAGRERRFGARPDIVDDTEG